MVLTVLIVWICLGVPVAVVFAAIAKGGLREEAARDLLPEPVEHPEAAVAAQLTVGDQKP